MEIYAIVKKYPNDHEKIMYADFDANNASIVFDDFKCNKRTRSDFELREYGCNIYRIMTGGKFTKFCKEEYDIIKLVADVTGFDKSKIKIIEKRYDDKRTTFVRFTVKGRAGNIIYSSIHGKYLFNLHGDFDK